MEPYHSLTSCPSLFTSVSHLFTHPSRFFLCFVKPFEAIKTLLPSESSVLFLASESVICYHTIRLVFVVISGFLHMGLCKWCSRRIFVLRKIWAWILPFFYLWARQQRTCLVASEFVFLTCKWGNNVCHTGFCQWLSKITMQWPFARHLAQSRCSKMVCGNNASASEGGSTTLWKLQKQHKNTAIKIISGPDLHETSAEEENSQGKDLTHYSTH